MTTSPVMSITDELVAELEALASECGQHGTNWYESRHMAAFPEYACDQDFVVAASPATILALLAERAELKQEVGRLNARLLLSSAHAASTVASCMAQVSGIAGAAAELQRDADRYKYLSEASLIVGIGWDHDGHFSPDPKAELDAAVDKAMGAAE